MPNAAPAIRYQLGKLVGYVVSTKMNKSITVNIPWLYKHPKYERVVTRRTKVMAHDEYELCSEGDMVQLKMSRRLSKRKAHVVEKILQKEDGSPPPSPFPTVIP